MHTYQVLQLVPVVVLIVIALALMRSPNASREAGRQPANTPAWRPAVGWVSSDGDFHETIVARKRIAVPQNMTAPMLSPRLTLAAQNQFGGAGVSSPTGARLVDLSGMYKAGSFSIPAAGATIGRVPSVSDIVLAESHISARHAWIGFVDGKPVLRDLNSTNGTFLNGQIDAPVTEVELRSGDTILLGRHQGEQFLFAME